MTTPAHPLYLAGSPAETGTMIDVLDKTTGAVAASVAAADAATIDAAIEAVHDAATEFARWPAWRRKRVLAHVVDRIGTEAESFAQTLALEAGKPIRDARGEVTRSIDTFTLAMEESTRIGGDMLPLDTAPSAQGIRGITKRVPVGPCSFITPFNFPLNLVAHKVGPALAAGCPFVLKPASSTPLSALRLGAVLAETDLPAGAFSVLPCRGSDAGQLVEDERIRHLSFTGSPDVGWAMKARCGRKQVSLELGGNAACIVDRGADLARAVDRLTMGAYYQSGQVCVSVQRVLAHRSVHEELRAGLIARAQALITGDPLEERTNLGPLITMDDALRIESWIGDAVSAGATVCTGGHRDGPFIDATIVENVPEDAALNHREVFGPVLTLEAFDDFADALRIANTTPFGLQAGVFTPDLHHAFQAWDELDVGGVVINDVPTLRVDAMPYGGVKASGLGREGVRYAIEALTEPRLMLLSHVGAGE